MDEIVTIYKGHIIKLYRLPPDCSLLYLLLSELSQKIIPLVRLRMDEVSLRLGWDEQKTNDVMSLLVDAKIVVYDSPYVFLTSYDSILELSRRKSYKYTLLRLINSFPPGTSESWTKVIENLQSIKESVESTINGGTQ